MTLQVSRDRASSDVNLAGILRGRRCGCGRLDGGEGWSVGRSYLSPLGEGSEPGLGHFPAKKRIFHLKWRASRILGGIFCPGLRQKNVEFSA